MPQQQARLQRTIERISEIEKTTSMNMQRNVISFPDLTQYKLSWELRISFHAAASTPTGAISPDPNLPVELNLHTRPTIHQAMPTQPVVTPRKPIQHVAIDLLIMLQAQPMQERMQGLIAMKNPQMNQLTNLAWMSTISIAFAAFASSFVAQIYCSRLTIPTQAALSGLKNAQMKINTVKTRGKRDRMAMRHKIAHAQALDPPLALSMACRPG